MRMLFVLVLSIWTSGGLFSQTEDSVRVLKNRSFGMTNGCCFGIGNHRSPAWDMNVEYRVQIMEHIGLVSQLGICLIGGVNEDKYDAYIRKAYHVPSKYTSPKVDGLNESIDLYVFSGFQYSFDVKKDRNLDVFILGGFNLGGSSFCSISYSYNGSYYDYQEIYKSSNYALLSGLDYRIKLNNFVSFFYRLKLLYYNVNMACDVNQWRQSQVVASEVVSNPNQGFFMGCISAGISFTISKRLPYRMLSKEYLKKMVN